MAGDSQIIKCVDCGTDFEFTLGEQRFFQEKGFKTPRRCPGCRQKKRAAGNPAPVNTPPLMTEQEVAGNEVERRPRGSRRNRGHEEY